MAIRVYKCKQVVAKVVTLVEMAGNLPSLSRYIPTKKKKKKKKTTRKQHSLYTDG